MNYKTLSYLIITFTLYSLSILLFFCSVQRVGWGSSGTHYFIFINSKFYSFLNGKIWYSINICK